MGVTTHDVSNGRYFNTGINSVFPCLCLITYVVKYIVRRN